MNPTPGPRLQDIAKPDECALTTERLGRILSLPLTRLALRLGLSANTVTLLAGGCWLLSLPVVVAGGWGLSRGAFVPGWILLCAAGVLWNAGYLLDLVDGNIARFRGTACPSGFFLDYVFHLLFKPAFLLSIGAALSLVHDRWLYLLPAVLSVPANWNPAESAVEHVICQLLGKGRIPLDRLSAAERAALLLGTSSIQRPVAEKTGSPLRRWGVFLQEVVSYYGQFSLFSLFVLVDLLVFAASPATLLLPVTTTAWWLLVLAMLGRVPFRIRREYRRMARFL